MKRAIIIHGTPSREEYFDAATPSESNKHWIPWLQKQLLIRDIFTQTPEMPDSYAPDYDTWKAEFERFPVDSETILIGHSCGGGFLLRWISENKIQLNKLILVAPWMDPQERKTMGFFDFEIDPKLQDRVNEIHVFVSIDDDSEILDSVHFIKKALPHVTFHEFTDKGHFCFEDMHTQEFPELLKTIVLSR